MGELVRKRTGNREVTTGLAGCGRMGLPMAQCLNAAGIPTLGFDIRAGDDFPGVPMTFSADEFGRNLETLFTVVRDTAQTDALLFDDQALVSKAPNLRTLVICSTLPPGYVTALPARLPAHISVVDAPMSGAAIAAEEARLTFMLGGAQETIDELMLHFSAMGQQFHRLGDTGAGMTAKVLNNLVAAASTVATRTALDWAGRHGIDRNAMLQVLDDSSGQTWFGSNFDRIEFARDGYASDNSIGLLAKDVACAETARPDGTPPAFTEALIAAIRDLKDVT